MSPSPDTGARRSFFRLIETDRPSREQFLSYYDRGLAPRGATGHQLHLYRGVSVLETEEQARRLASEARRQYRYIAEISVPQGVPVERHGHREGHHNVYAAPDDLLRWVVRVVPVRLQSPEGR